jgi:hypothetical protein
MKKEVNIGRPPKFQEECRAVTVTLPIRILHLLEKFDKERGRGIVKCVEAAMGNTSESEGKYVEIVPVTKDAALIVVSRSNQLANIPWLRLIEIVPGRFILSLPTGTAIESLELAVMDLIEKIPETEIAEKALLSQLRQHLSKYRRSDGVSKGEILFIAL